MRNVQYQANYEGMEMCCRWTLRNEMYRRDGAGEAFHVEGHTLKCPTCGGELICNSDGQSGKLRWRWNGGSK